MSAAANLFSGGSSRQAADYGAVESAVPSSDSVEPQPCFGSVDGHGQNSVALTAGIIIADVVGAGILSMGVAVSKFGWLLGTLVILALLAMNVHISILLWRVRMRCPNAFTYIQLADAAFAKAPETQRRLAVFFTGATQYTFILCVCGLYTLSIGKGIGGIFYEWRVCLPVLCLFGDLLLLPFHIAARTMGKWKSLIGVNVLSICGTVFVPLVYMASLGVSATRPPDAEMAAVATLSLKEALLGVEIMTFAFTSQFMLVEIISEMKEPADMPTAYYMSVPFQGVAFIICGVGAYYYMGDSITGMIGDNIPYGSVSQVAAVCLVVHMTITFLIKGIVFCRAFQAAATPSLLNDDSRKGWFNWALVVTVLVAVTWLVAQGVPFFTDMVDLLGASLTPISCYIIPIFIYARWLQDFGKKEDSIGIFERCLIVVEVLLALLTIVVGTYFAVENIFEQWNTLGAPFSCHCEDIWNTCECSASHAGMEYCSAESLAWLSTEPKHGHRWRLSWLRWS